MGVLGDKYVALSVGPQTHPLDARLACQTLEDGDPIYTERTIDIVDYTKRVTEILNSTASIGSKVDSMLGENQEAATASLSESFAHLEDMLRAAKEGEGLLHTLIYDETVSRRVDNILANLEVASSGLADASHQIQRGDGIANELIYGDNGDELASELHTLASALSAITSDIRNEESVIHTLIYDSTKTQIIEDLTVTAASLRSAAQALDDGDGTMALLLRDPVLYEDLRALVGGAQRNKLLRTYIRRSLEQSNAEDSAPWEPAE